MKRSGIPFRHGVTIVAVVFVVMSAPRPFFGGAPSKQENKGAEANASHPRFTDVTAKSALNYVNQSSRTSRKYLIEIMGPVVELFEYNNDGRLNVFVVNGALLEEPRHRAT